MLGQGCLCGGIRLPTNLQGGQYGGEKIAPEEVSYAKNGGGEWMEGWRDPVEVVCVDNAMIVVDKDGHTTEAQSFNTRLSRVTVTTVTAPT